MRRRKRERGDDRGLKPAPLSRRPCRDESRQFTRAAGASALEDAGNLAGHNGKCKREGECVFASGAGGDGSARRPLTRGVRGGLIPRKIFPLEIIVAAAAGLLTGRPHVCAEKTHPGERRGGGNEDNFWARASWWSRCVCFIEPASRSRERRRSKGFNAG